MIYKVEVVAFTDDNIVKIINCKSERQAEKVDVGLNINLNHAEYFTRIKEASDERD